jgi:hypothetical protein
METTFNSPQIRAILSDYRYDTIVPEGQYTVQFGSGCFKITVHDYTDLYYSPVNASSALGVIFIFPDYYRYDEVEGVDYDTENLHENDDTVSLCPYLLEVDENYEAPLDGYRIIVMTAAPELDDNGDLVIDEHGDLVYPPGHTVPHGKPLDVVKMSWE